MFLGIDAGGSKTHLCLIDVQNHIIAETFYDGCQLSRDSIRSIQQYISQFLTEQHIPLHQLSAVCLGIAGWDECTNQLQHQKLLQQYTPACHYTIISDGYLGLLRFNQRGPLIAITSGTGSILYGLTSSQKPFRLGGYGSYFGDQGSGYAIAQHAITDALRSLDQGRLSPIYKAAHRHFGTESLNQLLEQQHQIKHVASFAKEVLRLANAGVVEASLVIDRAATDLYQLVQSAISRNLIPHTGFKVGLHGGCLAHNSRLRHRVTDRLTQNHQAQILTPKHSAALTAALQAQLNSTR